MSTAGAHPGRLAEVAVSNAASSDYTSATYVDVEKVRNPSLAGEKKEADVSNNDSGGDEEHVVTWRSGTLSFEFIADWAAGGQDHVLDAHDGSQIRAWRYTPRGNTTTEPRVRFLGTVGFDNSNDSADAGKVRATVKRTGGFTRDTVP